IRRRKELLECRRYSPQNIIGKLRWPGEIDLKPIIAKLLGAKEDHHALGGEFVLPYLYARVLYVLSKLGIDEGPIARRRRKRLYFLNGVVCLVLANGQFKNVVSIQLLPDLKKRL